MKKLLTVAISALLLSACASKVEKELVATGGSKSDGTIELSYEQHELEMVTYNEQQALNAAKKRCEAWGYKNAEKFGGVKSQCTLIPGFWTPCGKTMFTIQYQCLDK